MNNEHILITDDDVFHLNGIVNILKRQGYRVSTAAEGKTALAMIQRAADEQHPIDLLITDLRMPVMDGVALIKQIRENNFDLNIIVMTGFGDRDTLKDLISLGCNDYLDKPFNTDQICWKVEKVLITRRKIREKYNKPLEDESKKNLVLSTTLESYKLRFEKIQKEMESAKVTYQDLIRLKEKPRDAAFVVRTHPLQRMGGDYLDVCNTPFGCDVLIADVAGHDMPATYHTMLIKVLFEDTCRTGMDGASFFNILNRALRESEFYGRMVTALYLRLNFKTMRANMLSAGHPGIIRTRKNRTTDKINSNGGFLGFLADISHEYREFDLFPEDRLFLFTDGVIGAYYADGPTGDRHALGEDGLIRFIEKHHQRPIEEMTECIWDEIFQFCRYKPSDDMLLIALEIPQEVKKC